MTQPTDMELLDAFLSQDDRLTHSGMMLSDCFSPSQFDLVFEYGTVIQKSAVRQALIACLSLPAVEPGAETPPRNATFEKHLEICCCTPCAALRPMIGFRIRSVLLPVCVSRRRRCGSCRIWDRTPRRPRSRRSWNQSPGPEVPGADRLD